jgi:hypothetical protein
MTSQQTYDRAVLVPEICKRLATGEPLAVICRDIGISRRTVGYWRQEDKEIAAAFDEARDDGFDAIARECMEIADDGRRDYEVQEDGRELVDHDHIQRSKLRVETRLKLLAKWDPRRYGEKQQLDHTSSDGSMSPKGYAVVPEQAESMAAWTQSAAMTSDPTQTDE